MNARPIDLFQADGATASAQLFVINLSSSTSPMALSQPDSPELKRYSFFVTRQREDGRERFRLHMGYFAAQADAESMLDVVREFYPSAWAGPEPANGGPRRNKVVVAPPAKAAPTPAVEPVVAKAQPQVAEPAKAEKPPQVAEPVKAKTPQPAVEPVVAKAAPAPREPASVPDKPAPAAAKREPQKAVAPAPVIAAAATPPANVLDTMSNVRNVLDQLSEPEVLNMLETSGLHPALDIKKDVRTIEHENDRSVPDFQPDAVQDDPENKPVCFAVQLVWSVSPIDAASQPHLAIFDAYTLYNVEGNRQGRKWYGLRLGFFSDPSAATQVANYVRSDYGSVAVVPVASKERDGASGTQQGSKAPAPRLGQAQNKPETAIEAPASSTPGFELLADDKPAPAKRDVDDKPVAPTLKLPVVKPAKPAPVENKAPKAAGKPTGKRVVARKRPTTPRAAAAPGAPSPLDSTLEILGAGDLSLDNTRSVVEDTASRKPLVKPSGNRFSRLFSRLSGN